MSCREPTMGLSDMETGVNVHAVAAAILEEKGEMSCQRLHRLVYWSQAWHLVWHDESLYDAEIRAWMDGPRIPQLSEFHEGVLRVDTWDEGDPRNLDTDQYETVCEVCEFYDEYETYVLGNIVRHERPWRLGRVNVCPEDLRGHVIETEWMREYYGITLIRYP